MARISQETIERVKSVTLVDLALALGYPTKISGKQMFIPCPSPHHPENQYNHCCIEMQKNIFNCFTCGDVKGNSSISLFSYHEFGEKEGHFKDSIIGIAKLMDIEVKDERGMIMAAGSNTYKPSVNINTQSLVPQPVQVVDAFYRAFLSLCPLRAEHAQELMNIRKYSVDEINLHLFRSVPTLEEWIVIYGKLKSLNYPFERIPGLSQIFQPDYYNSKIPKELGESGVFVDANGKTHNGHWFYTLSAAKGYFIPIHDENGYIVRLRVRKDSGDPKYVWFSSTHNIEVESTLQKARKNGVASGAPITLEVPPEQLKLWQRGKNVMDVIPTRTLLATEGEHKSKISAKTFNVLAAGLPGAGNFTALLPLIKKWNIQKLIIAYDMDTLQRPDESEKSYKKQAPLMEIVNRFAIEVAKLGVDCVIWTWNMNDGKGLDDLVHNRRLPIEINLRTQKKRAVTFNTVHTL